MQNFLYKLRAKFSQFMYGRYGADEFYNFLAILTCVLVVLNLIFRSQIITFINWFIIIYSIFRVLSKNYSSRRKENEFYLKISNKVKSFFKLKARQFKEKDYVFKKCPNCKQTLRLPRKKGQHTVCCPKCHQDFEVRI